MIPSFAFLLSTLRLTHVPSSVLMLLMCFWAAFWSFALASTLNNATYCEDYHMSAIEQFQLDAIILANYTMTKTLRDGTDFKSSTAYVQAPCGQTANHSPAKVPSIRVCL